MDADEGEQLRLGQRQLSANGLDIAARPVEVGAGTPTGRFGVDGEGPSPAAGPLQGRIELLRIRPDKQGDGGVAVGHGLSGNKKAAQGRLQEEMSPRFRGLLNSF